MTLTQIPLPMDGQYRLVMVPFLRFDPLQDWMAGKYSISVSLSEMNISEMLEPGKTVQGNLSPGEVMVYRYTGKAGEKIDIALTAENPAAGASSEQLAVENGQLDTYLVVRDPDLRFMVTEDDTGETTDSLIEDLVLPADGVYLIEVRSYKDLSGGGFSITVDSILPGK